MLVEESVVKLLTLAARPGRVVLWVMFCAASLSLASPPDSIPDSATPSGIPLARPCNKETAPAHSRIGRIEIDNQDIFDLKDSRENAWPYRLANHLHISTKRTIIQQQLLFKTGDGYDPRLLEESERILRSNHYFYDAKIVVLGCHEGTIDVKVTTQDVWSLRPSASLSRSGGKNSGGFEIREVNLLGYGSSLNLSKKSGVDRDTVAIGYFDRHLLGTWNTLDLNYSRNSDGASKSFAFARPFVALDSRWAAGVSALDDDRVESLYKRGESVDSFRHRQRYLQAFGGWSAGLVNGWTRRWSAGLTYDDHDFGPDSKSVAANVIPEDRKFVYPFMRFDLIEDKFETRRNYDQIGRNEDFYLGTQVSVQLGYASTGLGSSENSVLYEVQAGNGFDLGRTQSLLLSAGVSGRLTGSASQNQLLSASARYYWRQTERNLWYVALQGDMGHHLDIDRQLLLGGDNGLRGYPLRFESGDKRVLVTLEHRYFSSWYPLRLFRVGGAVFFDAGRAWGANHVGAQDQRWLSDVGFGLRLGSTRSGLGNIIHIDVAYPLSRDSAIKRRQIIVETKRSF